MTFKQPHLELECRDPNGATFVSCDVRSCDKNLTWRQHGHACRSPGATTLGTTVNGPQKRKATKPGSVHPTNLTTYTISTSEEPLHQERRLLQHGARERHSTTSDIRGAHQNQNHQHHGRSPGGPPSQCKWERNGIMAAEWADGWRVGKSISSVQW